MESEVALLDVGELTVDAPGAPVAGQRNGESLPRFIDAGSVEPPVERQPHGVQAHRRFGARAGGKGCVGRGQPVVEVFESRGPARGKGELDARARGPAWAEVEALVVRRGLARALRESPQGPSKAASAVEQPPIE